MFSPRKRLLISVLLALLIVAAGQFYLRYHYDLRRHNPANGVIILTTDWCPYCESLRKYLQAWQVPYQEYDVEDGWAGFWRHRASRARGVPVTIIGEEIIYGFNIEAINAQLRLAGHDVEAIDTSIHE